MCNFLTQYASLSAGVLAWTSNRRPRLGENWQAQPRRLKKNNEVVSGKYSNLEKKSISWRHEPLCLIQSLETMATLRLDYFLDSMISKHSKMFHDKWRIQLMEKRSVLSAFWLMQSMTSRTTLFKIGFFSVIVLSKAAV